MEVIMLGETGRKARGLGGCAAAIVFGWFLMVPPIDVATRQVNDHAPLSQWQRAGDYDSLAQCLAVRKDILRHVIAPALDQTAESAPHYTKLASRCLRAGDPRLAPAPKL
jgi:hypothetical protein